MEEALRRIEFVKKEGFGTLDLGFLRLQEIPKEIEDVSWISTLILNNNLIEKIERLNILKSLRFLDLEENMISEIQGLENLTSLEELKLNNNKIVRISGLETLTSLKVLHLKENRITQIIGLEKLINLKLLNLSLNQIREITKLDKLVSLRDLYIHSNNLEKIDGLKNLKLKALILDNNLINNIDVILDIKTLLTLSLTKNNIENLGDIHKFYKLISQLNNLQIKQNPLNDEWINPEILQHVGDNVKSVKNLIEEYINKQKIIYKDLPLKIILLGNTNAGKSTTALSIMESGENPKDREKTTHGLTIRKLTDSKAKNKAIIYDFGGQDYYHNTYSLFFSHKSLFVVLWKSDADENRKNPNSEAGLDSYNFHQRYWLGNVKYYFTKKRIFESKFTDNDQPEALVGQPVYLVQNLYQQDNITYKLDSIEIKEFGVDQQFHVSYPIEAGRDLPYYVHARYSLYHQINAWIEQNSKEKGFTNDHHRIFNQIVALHDQNKDNRVPISVEDFQNQFKIKKEEKWFIRLLNDRGIIYYLESIDKIWLNPEGVSYTIHRAFTKESALINGGMFSEVELNIMFSEELKTLLLETGIIHHDKYDSKYIVPQYLPIKPENDPLLDLATMDIDTGFYIKYKDYLPHGLMARLICRFGSNPGKKHYYRDQIIFSMLIDDHDSLAKVLISIDFISLKISVKLGLTKAKEHLRNELYRYLFKAILAAYWDIEHKDYFNSKAPVVFNALGMKFEFKTFQSSIWAEELNEKLKSKKDDSFDNQIKPIEYLDIFRNCSNIEMDLSLDDIWYVNYKKQLHSKEECPAYVTVTTDDKKEKSVSTSMFNPFLPRNAQVSTPKKLFISYSSKNSEYMKRFLTHLGPLRREGLVSEWVDRMITTGHDWNESIQTALDSSDIIVYLLSPDFLNNDYILNDELGIGIDSFQNSKGSAKEKKLYFVQLMPNAWVRHKVFKKVQHLLDPAETGKEIVYIDKADNDAAWIKYIDDLEKNLLLDK